MNKQIYEYEKDLNYKKFIEIILKHEGKLSNDKTDVGGLTYKGIAYRYNKDNFIFKIIFDLQEKGYSTKQINEYLEKDIEVQKKVKDFYYNNYYKNFNYHKTPNEIPLVLTSFSILFGGKRFSKKLQKVINNYLTETPLVVDGLVGSNTINALEDVLKDRTSKEIALALLLESVDAIIESVNYRSSNIKFLKGWINRVIKTYNLIKRV